jgi:hypothetical protein
MQNTGSDTREQNKQWLLLSVNEILEPMMLEIFNQKPEDHVITILFHLYSSLDHVYASVP